MNIIWDSDKITDFIKLCIDSLNKTKETQIKLKWIETNESEQCFEVGMTVYGSGIFTWTQKLDYQDIYALFGKAQDEPLDLNNLSDQEKLKLGKYVITMLWTGLINKI